MHSAQVNMLLSVSVMERSANECKSPPTSHGTMLHAEGGVPSITRCTTRKEASHPSHGAPHGLRVTEGSVPPSIRWTSLQRPFLTCDRCSPVEPGWAREGEAATLNPKLQGEGGCCAVAVAATARPGDTSGVSGGLHALGSLLVAPPCSPAAWLAC